MTLFLLMHETFTDTHGNSFAYMDCVALLEWLKTFIKFLTWIMTCQIWLNYVRIVTIIILMWITYHMWLIYVIIAILKLPCEINIWIIFQNHLRTIEKQNPFEFQNVKNKFTSYLYWFTFKQHIYNVAKFHITIQGLHNYLG
jgi:hypothetical protein